MTGIERVVNVCRVSPATAPQETLRRKRRCPSSAIRIRWSRVSSRKRAIRASWPAAS